MAKNIFFLILILVPTFIAKAQKVEGRVVGDSKGIIYDIKYNADGSYLANTLQQQVQVWETVNYQLSFTFSGHRSKVINLYFLGNDVICSGDENGYILLWNKNGTIIKEINIGNKIKYFTISDSGNKIATTAEDNIVQVWNVSEGKLIAKLEGHKKSVTCLTFSKNEEFIISGSGDKTIKIWDVENQSLFKSLIGHKSWVREVKLVSKGDTIASCGDDKTVMFWVLNEKSKTTPVTTFKNIHNNWITGMDFHESGRYMATTGHDNNLGISSITSYKAISPATKYVNFLHGNHGNDYGHKVVFKPGSYTVAIASLGKGIIVSDFFDKIFLLPHELKIISINDKEVDGSSYTYKVSDSKIIIKGEISRPKYVKEIILSQDEVEMTVSLKRNGTFKIPVNLTAGTSLRFIIKDIDRQINNTGHYLEIKY